MISVREVKFRGMDIVNNKWLYGNLEIPLINQSKSKYFIIGYSYGQYQKLEVNPKTVGQYTGLKDKNGKGIYEGDIVRFHYKTGVYKIGTVVWNDLFGSWDIDCSDFVSYKSLGQYKSVSEVIGNIYENPELLEESK